MKKQLDIASLTKEAKRFCELESKHKNSDLYGVTDGKAVGTYVEHKFQKFLQQNYLYTVGSSARGIDLPDKHINTDIKVTSARQPQSSCPFKSASQKIFGLGYNLLLFVYEKIDNPTSKTTSLNFVSCAFIDKIRTADYQITKTLCQMIDNEANEEDIIAYLSDRNIPADEITLSRLAAKILSNPPQQGYITISNALQWRLQYKRIVKLSEIPNGITKIIE